MSKIEIYNQDCLQLLKQMPDNSVDFVCIDPPYDLKISQNEGGCLKSLSKIKTGLNEIKNGFDIDITFLQIERISKKMNMICFCSNKQISKIMNWGEHRNYITTLLTWHKQNMPPFTKGTWKQDLEFAIHIRESGATFNDVKSQWKSKIYLSNYQANEFGHPTQKPLALIERYIQICSNENDTVFDCFLGSGTTAIAAHNLNRNFIGCELDKDYFELAQKRIDRHTTQTKLF